MLVPPETFRNGDAAELPGMLPPTPGTLQTIEEFISTVEDACSDETWRQVNPEHFQVVRAKVRVVSATLDLLEASRKAGHWDPTEQQQHQIEDLMDRADELADTLGWAAEAPGKLAGVAEQER